MAPTNDDRCRVYFDVSAGSKDSSWQVHRTIRHFRELAAARDPATVAPPRCAGAGCLWCGPATNKIQQLIDLWHSSTNHGCDTGRDENCLNAGVAQGTVRWFLRLDRTQLQSTIGYVQKLYAASIRRRNRSRSSVSDYQPASQQQSLAICSVSTTA